MYLLGVLILSTRWKDYISLSWYKYNFTGIYILAEGESWIASYLLVTTSAAFVNPIFRKLVVFCLWNFSIYTVESKVILQVFQFGQKNRLIPQKCFVCFFIINYWISSTRTGVSSRDQVTRHSSFIYSFLIHFCFLFILPRLEKEVCKEMICKCGKKEWTE